MGIFNDNVHNPHSTTNIVSKMNNNINLNDIYSKNEIDTVTSDKIK